MSGVLLNSHEDTYLIGLYPHNLEFKGEELQFFLPKFFGLKKKEWGLARRRQYRVEGVFLKFYSIFFFFLEWERFQHVFHTEILNPVNYIGRKKHN